MYETPETRAAWDAAFENAGTKAEIENALKDHKFSGFVATSVLSQNQEDSYFTASQKALVEEEQRKLENDEPLSVFAGGKPEKLQHQSTFRETNNRATQVSSVKQLIALEEAKIAEISNPAAKNVHQFKQKVFPPADRDDLANRSEDRASDMSSREINPGNKRWGWAKRGSETFRVDLGSSTEKLKKKKVDSIVASVLKKLGLDILQETEGQEVIFRNYLIITITRKDGVPECDIYTGLTKRLVRIRFDEHSTKAKKVAIRIEARKKRSTKEDDEKEEDEKDEDLGEDGSVDEEAGIDEAHDFRVTTQALYHAMNTADEVHVMCVKEFKSIDSDNSVETDPEVRCACSEININKSVLDLARRDNTINPLNHDAGGQTSKTMGMSSHVIRLRNTVKVLTCPGLRFSIDGKHLCCGSPTLGCPRRFKKVYPGATWCGKKIPHFEFINLSAGTYDVLHKGGKICSRTPLPLILRRRDTVQYILSSPAFTYRLDMTRNEYYVQRCLLQILKAFGGPEHLRRFFVQRILETVDGKGKLTNSTSLLPGNPNPPTLSNLPADTIVTGIEWKEVEAGRIEVTCLMSNGQRLETNVQTKAYAALKFYAMIDFVWGKPSDLRYTRLPKQLATNDSVAGQHSSEDEDFIIHLSDVEGPLQAATAEIAVQQEAASVDADVTMDEEDTSTSLAAASSPVKETAQLSPPSLDIYTAQQETIAGTIDEVDQDAILSDAADSPGLASSPTKETVVVPALPASLLTPPAAQSQPKQRSSQKHTIAASKRSSEVRSPLRDSSSHGSKRAKDAAGNVVRVPASFGKPVAGPASSTHTGPSQSSIFSSSEDVVELNTRRRNRLIKFISNMNFEERGIDLKPREDPDDDFSNLVSQFQVLKEDTQHEDLIKIKDGFIDADKWC